MPISKEETIKLAELCRLSVNEADLPQLVNDLDKVLGYVQKLQTIVADESQDDDKLSLKLRPDEVQNFSDTSGLIKAAPQHDENVIITPPIFTHRL